MEDKTHVYNLLHYKNDIYGSDVENVRKWVGELVDSIEFYSAESVREYKEKVKEVYF